MAILSACNCFRARRIRRMLSPFRCCFYASSTTVEVSDQELDIPMLSTNGQETSSRTPTPSSEQQRNSETLNANNNQESHCNTSSTKEDADRSNGTNSVESNGLIEGRWKRGKLLGKGDYGEVFQAVDTETSEEVAMKMEPIPKDEFCRSTLPIESNVYKALKESSNPTGFAQMLFYGRTGHQNALVMTRLGRSLKDLQEFCGGKFSAKTVLMIGIQAVTRIQQMHDARYAHYDIHRRNILIGERDSDTVYLVDFGSARKLSRSGSSGFRRSDMLSLGQVLVTISSGKEIFWFGLVTKEEFLQEVRERCSDVPEVTQFVGAVYDLLFTDQSDYESLKEILRAGLVNRNLTNDRMFDWMEAS